MKRIIQAFSLAWACFCLTWLAHAQTQPAPQPTDLPATPASDNPPGADAALLEALRQSMATNAAASGSTNLQRRSRQVPPGTSTPGPATPTTPVPASPIPTTPAAVPATQTPLVPSPGTVNTPAAQPTPAAQLAPPTVTIPPTVTAQPQATSPITTPPGLGAVAPAQSEEANFVSGLNNPDDIVDSITFANMALDQVLDYYASLSGRTILKPQALAANITLKTQSKLTRKEALQALDSVLALNGVTMIPVGQKFVKAVAPAQALLEGTAFSKFSHDQLPEADQFVTHILQLKNANPVEVIPVIQGLAKNPAGILGIEATRMIVLRDYAANVKRMLEVIDRIDVVPEMDYKLEVIPIKFGRVEEIYATMSSLIGGGGGGAAVPGATGAAARRTTASRAGSGSRLGGQQQRYGQQQLGQQPGQPVAPAASQGSFQDRLRQIVNRAAGGEMQLLGDAKIVPDERSNTLIVFANKQDMEMITNIVSKVDVLLAQVLIEAIIVDVGVGSNWNVGVSTLQHPRADGNVSHAGLINNGQGFLNNITNFPNGLGGGFTYLARYNNDLSVAVQAFASDNKAQVVQTPRIQTSHAVPASFFNGETRPYPTSSYGGYGGGIGVGGYPSIQYQQLEVGVGIEVTPYITPDDLVVMEITQTIDGIIGTEELANIGKVPITSRRTATATVSVRNKDTILLGGFINSQNTKSKSGVPLLKDIPVLGALFRSSSDDTKRSELIILMRPTILQTPQDAALAAQAERERLPGIVDAERKFREDMEKKFNKTKK